MQGNSRNKEEAERWLNLAEKLLEGRDLVGCKTFAIRARESDPRLEHADLILAVVDTLMAGQLRVNDEQRDWYAVLQLSRLTRDLELIATQYRKLVHLLNPQLNRLPYSDEAFGLVSDAWSVLSNPSKKWFYDNELTLLDSAGSNQQWQQRKSPNNIGGGREEQRGTKHPNFSESTRRKVPSQAESTPENIPVHDESGENFWTACPYCYCLFEYPRVYEDCTLRCQNCRRAFHGVMIPSPPALQTGQDGTFCCWGFFPVGFSEKEFKNNANITGGAHSWSPFSPMFVCPTGGDNQSAFKSNGASQKKARPKAVIIDDDDDVLLEISDESDDSDDDWNSAKERKKAKNAKGKSPAKSGRKGQVEKAKNVNQKVGDQATGSNGANLQGVFANASVGETSHKATGNVSGSSRKQSGRHAKELGKLDLNVEFSNEVEAPMAGVTGGHGGTEDNIEGIAFFEGLDEFLNSLPILSSVGGDDKVKAA